MWLCVVYTVYVLLHGPNVLFSSCRRQGPGVEEMERLEDMEAALDQQNLQLQMVIGKSMEHLSRYPSDKKMAEFRYVHDVR